MAQNSAEIEKLVHFLVDSIIDNRDALEISTSEVDDVVTVELTVDPDDIGKVIGRQGRVIKAIRTLARAAGSQSNLHVEVEVNG